MFIPHLVVIHHLICIDTIHNHIITTIPAHILIAHLILFFLNPIFTQSPFILIFLITHILHIINNNNNNNNNNINFISISNPSFLPYLPHFFPLLLLLYQRYLWSYQLFLLLLLLNHYLPLPTFPSLADGRTLARGTMVFGR